MNILPNSSAKTVNFTFAFNLDSTEVQFFTAQLKLLKSCRQVVETITEIEAILCRLGLVLENIIYPVH